MKNPTALICTHSALGTALRVALISSALLSASAYADSKEAERASFANKFIFVGQVQPKTSQSISDNDWSVGAEAQDRNYSTYTAWKDYLGRLGVKRVRLQSGWQRTDLGQGKYDYSWLDPVVDGIHAQGVQPWMSLEYGNENYPDGGKARRDSPLPKGEALLAWQNYVTTTVKRYKGKVNEFEIWNEPDLIASITAEAYGEFAYITAKAIKAGNPNARILLGAFAASVWKGSKSREFAKTAVETFVKRGGLGYAYGVTYHSYSPNPDAVYASLPSFITDMKAIDPGLVVRQGENGAPSLNQPHYALKNMWWTEQSQAKWLLRRALGDAAHGVPTSIFSLTEMHYPVAAETNLAFNGHATNLKPAARSTKHFKGLLETRLYAPDTPEDDRTVVRSKMGYNSYQAVTAIFDKRLKLLNVSDYHCDVTGSTSSLRIAAFRRDDGQSVLTVWRDSDIPDDNIKHEDITLSCTGLSFKTTPVYVDLLTRATYDTNGLVDTVNKQTVISGLPVYDSPILVADQALVVAR